MGDIIAREHIGLQVFAFCVVNVSDEHSRFKKNLSSGLKATDIFCNITESG